MYLFVFEFKDVSNDLTDFRCGCRRLVEEVAKSIFSSQEIQLCHDVKSRPFLMGSSYNVSYSHTENIICMIFSTSRVGIDVESIDRRGEVRRLKDYAFSSREIEERTDPLEQWCLKEASLKKLGDGFVFANPVEYTILRKGGRYQIQFCERNIDAGFFLICEVDNYMIVICSDSIINNFRLGHSREYVYSRL